MEDLLIAIGAGVIELLVYLTYPVRFLISPSYRAKVKSRWAQQARWVVVMEIVFGVIMYLLYAAVVYVACAVLLALTIAQ